VKNRCVSRLSNLTVFTSTAEVNYSKCQQYTQRKRDFHVS